MLKSSILKGNFYQVFKTYFENLHKSKIKSQVLNVLR